ncbi:MAG: hypothetical protein ACRDTG_01015 [Pseudonocardiaceae bacterium]
MVELAGISPSQVILLLSRQRVTAIVGPVELRTGHLATTWNLAADYVSQEIF